MTPAPEEGALRAPPKAVFCIAGTSSGVGKSSMVVGIAAALRERGLKVQAFKVGPDFIDPMHHEAATGRPSINLDSWMLSREQVLAAFHRAAAGADVAVVEGVMGLFDGRDGATEQGSTAQLAKWLGAPVVLVMDASAVARSAAALAKGYIEFDPQLRLAGLLFNKVGGAAHTQWLRDALEAAGIQAAVLGGVPKSEAVAVPERHLGLHMPGDEGVPPNLVAALAQLAAAHVDLDALLELGATADVPPPPPVDADAPAARGAEQPAAAAAQQEQQQGERGRKGGAGQPRGRVRIAVARDAAFCFYYHDNLHLLRAAGADLVLFSPLVDPLPADVAGVYLGGGYPERHAAELAENRVLRASLAAFARAGGVVYAECGGLLYLSKSIQPHPEEAARAMVGVFPFRAVMSASRMTMGYVEVETLPGCPLFPAGRRVRGQVFHFSEIVQESVVPGLGQALAGKAEAAAPAWSTCYRVQPQVPGAAEAAEGFHARRVLASYVHLHFGNCPDFAASLVDACRQVDLDAVAAAVRDAAAAAASLQSAVTSLHSTPQSASKGMPRGGVPHCRSSPDFSREERLAAKQRAAAAAAGGADHLRGRSEDGLLPTARYSVAAAGEPGQNVPRHASMPAPGAARSLSPATTLSKVMSMNSLSSYSPHVGVGALPPGEVLSPPLSESPQQLSPRELEAGGGGGAGGGAYFAAVPAGLHHQQQHFGQHCGGLGLANGHSMGHHPPPHVPPLPLEAAGVAPYGGLRQQHGGGGAIPGSYSWPRLHPPLAPHPGGGRAGASAFACAAAQHSHAPYAVPVSGSPYLGPSGSASAAWTPSPVGGGLHSRSASYERFERPPSAGVGSGGGGGGAAAAARSPAGLELHSGLEPRHLALSATPYNWQHSHTPSDRIVSLSPGATEMLWALGLGARVAAVSDACDHPPEAAARAKARRSLAARSSSPASTSSLRRPSSASGGTSAAGSRRESPTCGGAARRAAPAWHLPLGGAAAPQPHAHRLQLEPAIDDEVLARERPGLVVYEEPEGSACSAPACAAAGALHCGGCGLGRALLEALVVVGLQQSCRVVCVRRRTLADVLESMLAVGEAAGVRDEAVRTVDRLRLRLRRAAAEAALAAAAAPARPRVLVLASLRPLRTLGCWLPDLVSLAGGDGWAEEAPGDAAAELSWDQVRAFAPDVLVVAGMQRGSALAPLTDLCTVASLPGWWLLPAVRASAVFVADAALFARPGPRLVEGLECLARMLWEERAPACATPERSVLKLSLRPGQRCRPRLLPNHFVPFA